MGFNLAFKGLIYSQFMMHGQKNIRLLCAVVGTEGHQHRLEVCTMCGRFVSVLQNDRAVPNLFALNLMLKIF